MPTTPCSDDVSWRFLHGLIRSDVIGVLLGITALSALSQKHCGNETVLRNGLWGSFADVWDFLVTTGPFRRCT